MTTPPRNQNRRLVCVFLRDSVTADALAALKPGAASTELFWECAADQAGLVTMPSADTRRLAVRKLRNHERERAAWAAMVTA